MEVKKERIQYSVPTEVLKEEEARKNLEIDLNQQQQKDEQMQSPLQVAQSTVEQNMPPAYDGKYKTPSKQFEEPVETEYKSQIEQTKFGKSGVHMLDTKFSLSKNAGPAIPPQMDESGSEEVRTIKKSALNMVRICTTYLNSKLKAWEDGSVSPHDLVLTLRGTNKLANATDLTTRLVMDWLMENYKEHPEFAKYIKFDLIKCNASTDEETRRELDLNEEKKTHVSKASVSNTAVYSGATSEEMGAQKIYGANKLILAESTNPDDLVFSNKLNSISNGIHFYSKSGECESITSLSKFHEKLEGMSGIPKHRKIALEDMAKKYFVEHNMEIDLDKMEEPTVEEKTEKDKKPEGDPKGNGSNPETGNEGTGNSTEDKA